MDRIARMCDEIRAFGSSAERTGVQVELGGMKAHSRTCTSLTDLVRKYKLYGDGLFYLPVGQWPQGENELTLDNMKWMGVTRAGGEQKKRKRRTSSATAEK